MNQYLFKLFMLTPHQYNIILEALRFIHFHDWILPKHSNAVPGRSCYRVDPITGLVPSAIRRLVRYFLQKLTVQN